MTLDIPSFPKVVLHDHLDGGLRPSTVLELAQEVGYRGLPTTDPDDLAEWFDQSGSSSLEEYLTAFEHTTAVMSTPEALERVAYEAAEDLAADGVVYAEIRFAPSLHNSDAMDRRTAADAVVRGLEAAERDHGVITRAIVDALRQHDDSTEVAAMAVEAGGRVVAFDLAGPEAGYPNSDYAEACSIALDGGLRLTLHAGEGDGVANIADALSCGAQRIGHGVRIIEDTTIDDGAIVGMGAVAARVLGEGIALEVCPHSNLHTHMYPTPADHPVGLLYRAGFPITLNTDNRLMSRTTMSREFELVTDHHGFTKEDLRVVTLQGVDAAFCDDDTRRRVRERVEAGYV